MTQLCFFQWCKYREVAVCVLLVAFPRTYFGFSKYCKLKPAYKTTSIFARSLWQKLHSEMRSTDEDSWRK